jgi:uncharacterized repeat protein (TIGR03803 family)
VRSCCETQICKSENSVTKTYACKPLTHAPASSRKDGSAAKPALLKMAALVFMFCAATALASPATVTFTSLVSFDGTNGAAPRYISLVQGVDGNFYGTTSVDGANGHGTVFKITPAGALTTIYSFCAQSNCTDGIYPYAGLAQDSQGNFYGTTSAGGANGDGTVFTITPAGVLTTLHSFDSTDGATPYAGLLLASDGTFYGTTGSGGANNDGTIFNITPAGTLTTLHSFDSTDGSLPYGGLVQDSKGNFYGTTVTGGAYGHGTAFQLNSGGTLTTLHSFNSSDGEYPYAGLVQDSKGNFYGTTYDGGTAGDGTAFEITVAGALTTIYSFCSQSGCSDGSTPEAELVQGTDGNFYGTTAFGGPNGYGTAFALTAGGTLTTLHQFDRTDGSNPVGGLFQATNGTLYGTTYEGGTNQDGTVFSLGVGLGPFVATVPTSGKVGAAVIILGTNLKGSTKVTFGGKSAKFRVISPSEIETTLPKGAKTGKVEVKTPKGTLKSNVVFRVTK